MLKSTILNQLPTELNIKARDDHLAFPRSGDHSKDHVCDIARLKTIPGVGKHLDIAFEDKESSYVLVNWPTLWGYQ